MTLGNETAVETQVERDEESLASVLAALLISIGGCVLGGVVLRDMWMWFIAPLGPPAIGIAHAIGVMTVFGFLTARNTNDINRKKTRYELLVRAIAGIIAALLFWGIAAIVHLFM